MKKKFNKNLLFSNYISTEKKNLLVADENFYKIKKYNRLIKHLKKKKFDIILLSQNKNSKIYKKKKISFLDIFFAIFKAGFDKSFIYFFKSLFSIKGMLLINKKKSFYRNKFLHFCYVYLVILNFYNFFNRKSETYRRLYTICYYNS